MRGGPCTLADKQVRLLTRTLLMQRRRGQGDFRTRNEHGGP